jgi:hypothetical protein
MSEAVNAVGIPAIKNWYELKTTKWLYEMRDDPKLVNFAYVKNNYTGLYTYLGKCIGYGIPASVQFSNPMKEEQIGSFKSWSWGLKPQPEPNGLFMPAGLDATYIMYIIEETGDIEPWYCEDKITVTRSAMPKRLVQTREDVDRMFFKAM